MSPEMMNSPGFGGMGFPGMYGGGYGGRIIPPRRTPEDNLVLEKHRSIYPAEEDLQRILDVVDKVERCLKTISDKFVEEADSGSTEREVTGVARVGDLAKTLCLRGYRTVELVVLCSHRPTTSLLQTITAALTTSLATPDSNEAEEEEKKEEAGSDYSVTECEEASGLTVTAPACSVSVSLTSPVLSSSDISTLGTTVRTSCTEQCPGKLSGKLSSRNKLSPCWASSELFSALLYRGTAGQCSVLLH